MPRDPFTVIEECLEPEHHTKAIMTYVALCRLANERRLTVGGDGAGVVVPRARLAEAAKMHERTVRRMVQVLVELDLVAIEPQFTAKGKRKPDAIIIHHLVEICRGSQRV